jgi:hypothetical protein
MGLDLGWVVGLRPGVQIQWLVPDTVSETVNDLIYGTGAKLVCPETRTPAKPTPMCDLTKNLNWGYPRGERGDWAENDDVPRSRKFTHSFRN